MSTLLDPATIAHLGKLCRELVGVPEANVGNPLLAVVRTTHRQVKKDTAQPFKEKAEADNGLTNLLDKFNTLERVTVDFTEKTAMKHVLETVQKPTMPFSKVAQEKAAALIERFSAQEWGKSNLIEQETHKRKSTTTLPTHAAKKSKKAKGEDDEMKLIKKPYPDDHPIFGNNGPFPGCVVVYNPNSKHASIRGSTHGFARKDPKFSGHNGFHVGDWFPNQFSAWACGCHGSPQGGICGNSSEGAYSVLLMKAYAGADKGDLQGFVYWAPKTIENANQDALTTSTGLSALRKSHEHRHPIRVLRGAGACAGAPAEGIRYDGLYRIVAEVEESNEDGGFVIAFRMRRLPGQPAVDQTRPTRADRRVLENVKGALAEMKAGR